MVDVDRRTPSQTFALRRLSTRATSIPSSPSTSHAAGLLSFASTSSAILEKISTTSKLLPGLTEAQFIFIESTFNFSFPPDLRSLLSINVPSGPSFPNWHSDNLRTLFDIPLAVASLAVSRGHLWPRSWGPRPSNPPHRPLVLARSAIRRAPVLIPLFGRFYLPASPSIAGNPVFYVEEDLIICCASSLQEFFLSNIWHAKIATNDNNIPDKLRSSRWVEFWSDAAASERRRRFSSSSSSDASSSTSSSSPSRNCPPDWVGELMGKIESVLRDGGWGEDDVSEMVEGAMEIPCDERGIVDAEVVMDELFVRGERWGDELRKAGWRDGDFNRDLCFDLSKWRRRERRREVTLPKKMVGKMEEIVEVVGIY